MHRLVENTNNPGRGAEATDRVALEGETANRSALAVMAVTTGLAVRVLRVLRTPRQQRQMNRTFAALFVGAAALLATVRRAPA